MAKVFSVQPRFKYGDQPSGWSLVEGIFNLGKDIPPYGSSYRDAYLAWEWMNEPMTAGVFSTWTEKAQTVNWKITGGRNNANTYARMLQGADGEAGWSYHEGACAISYLSADKGSIEEIGRDSINEDIINKLRKYDPVWDNQKQEYIQLQQDLELAAMGKVVGIQHLDPTRLVKIGLPGLRWRYYSAQDTAISIPDTNLVQIQSMPSNMDYYRGYGLCSLSRIINAKNLMLGYLNYYRQEIGDLPPELIVIVNGMAQTDFNDTLQKYKLDKQSANLDEYGKIMWLGSDDPMNEVNVNVVSLINNLKSFNYQTMVEWWMKVLALNVGEDVGEFWLLQRGESKTVQSIQAMKAKGKGVAKYLAEKERQYNIKIMPFGVRFEYDNQDDDADKMSQEILSMKIGNLTAISQLGLDRQDPVYTKEQIIELCKQWDILPPEISGEEVPAVLGAMLKEVGSDDIWEVTSGLKETKRSRWLNSERDIESARRLYQYLGTIYPQNGYVQHQKLNKVHV